MRHFTIALFLFISLNTIAQSSNEPGAISGIILDEAFDKTPLLNAVISVQESYHSATSDFKGKFKINRLRPGTYNIFVRYLGYEDVIINNVNVEAGKTTSIKASMQSLVAVLEEKVVTE